MVGEKLGEVKLHVPGRWMQTLDGWPREFTESAMRTVTLERGSASNSRRWDMSHYRSDRRLLMFVATLSLFMITPT
jgi:hypothetical protein